MIKKPFVSSFDLKTGGTNEKVTERYLSNMKGMFADEKAFENILKDKDPKIYDFTEMGFEEVKEDLLYGTSITYPGKVGNEYFMTKGHFHTILETAEVYYCISGEGYMLMETPEGEWQADKLEAGKAVYVPARWAHRSINSGKTPLVTFFCFRADAGHDYGTIESKGFRKLIVEKDGKPEIIDNPKWKA
ncbi:MAG: glucose-6-phosphate isomerase [Firmicutes bacterium HGW-Firmicutes-1]|nr:MAG: glucose-6-phosphate isomerase [Firmicutes bacterium HGW-Firmicutes-1]